MSKIGKKKHWKGPLYWSYMAYCWFKGKRAMKKLVENIYYTSTYFPNSRFLYRGDGLFYMAQVFQCGPVSSFSQKEYRPKVWELGILDFKAEIGGGKNLSVETVLVVYDVPQVILAKDISGGHYICLLTNVDSKGNLDYLCVVVSTTRLHQLTEGHVDLRYVFVNPEDKALIYKGTEFNDGTDFLRVFPFPYEEITEEMLPKRGFYLKEN